MVTGIMDNLLLALISFAISSIPLYLALHLIGARRAGFLKVVFVNILAAIVVSAIFSFFGTWAGLIAFIAVLFIYKEMFDIGWISAFLAWLLQFVIVIILVAIIALLLGIALVL